MAMGSAVPLELRSERKSVCETAMASHWLRVAAETILARMVVGDLL